MTAQGADEAHFEKARRVAALRKMRMELERRQIIERRDVCYLARRLGYDIAPLHQGILEWQDEHEQSIALAPRGFGKSTIGTIARIVFEIARNRDIRILIVSKTSMQASRFLREVKQHLEGNEWLLEVFGAFVDPQHWAQTEIAVTGRKHAHKESTVTTLGVGGPVASGHYDLIIADDITDRTNTRTEAARAEMEAWISDTLIPAVVDESSRVSFLGTPYHPLDIFSKLPSKGYPVKRWPAIVDGESILPERFPMRYLMKLKERQGSAAFSSQFLMDTELMEGDIFRREWFQLYDEPPRIDGEKDGRPYEPWEDMDAWQAGDPAATRADVVMVGRKTDSDYWTIGVAARETRRGASGELEYGPRLYFRYLWRGRVTKATYLRTLKDAYDRFNPIVVALERAGQQEHLIQDAMESMPVRRVERHTDKVSRCYGVQAYYENSQIWFPAPHLRGTPEGDEDVWEACIDEHVLFPNGEHDDLVDVCEMLIRQSFGAQVEVFVG